MSTDRDERVAAQTEAASKWAGELFTSSFVLFRDGDIAPVRTVMSAITDVLTGHVSPDGAEHFDSMAQWVATVLLQLALLGAGVELSREVLLSENDRDGVIPELLERIQRVSKMFGYEIRTVADAT